MPSSIMDDMWSDIQAEDEINLGFKSQADRAQEAAEKAAIEISKRVPTPKRAPKSTKTAAAPRKSSKIRDAIKELEGVDIESSNERIEREADQRHEDAEPIVRPSGQVYHPRMFADKVDVRVLRTCRENAMTLLLSGFPGCGKTSLVEAAYMEPDDRGPVTVAGHGEMEMSEIIGRYVVRPGNLYEWVDGPLLTAMKEGRVFFIDDCTLIPTGVLARLYPVMDGRGVITVDEHEGETVTAAPGFYVIGAHNPGVPGAILSEALASRFSIHLDVPTDFELAFELGVERDIVNLAIKLTAERERQETSWAPAMRELLAYVKIRDLFGREVGLRNLISICPELDRDHVANAVKALAEVPQALSLGQRA